MILFKKYRKKLREEAMTEALSTVSAKAIERRKRLEKQIAKLNEEALADLYKHEDNIRWHMMMLATKPDLYHKFVEEIAEVINDKSHEYGYRIARRKREALAEDIVDALGGK